MIEIGDLRLYTLDETAEKLHLTGRAVRSLTRKGELKVFKKVGRRNYISEANILAWLEGGNEDDTKKND